MAPPITPGRLPISSFRQPRSSRNTVKWDRALTMRPHQLLLNFAWAYLNHVFVKHLALQALGNFPFELDLHRTPKVALNCIAHPTGAPAVLVIARCCGFQLHSILHAKVRTT